MFENSEQRPFKFIIFCEQHMGVSWLVDYLETSCSPPSHTQMLSRENTRLLTENIAMHNMPRWVWLHPFLREHPGLWELLDMRVHSVRVTDTPLQSKQLFEKKLFNPKIPFVTTDSAFFALSYFQIFYFFRSSGNQTRKIIQNIFLKALYVHNHDGYRSLESFVHSLVNQMYMKTRVHTIRCKSLKNTPSWGLKFSRMRSEQTDAVVSLLDSSVLNHADFEGLLLVVDGLQDDTAD